MFSDVATDGHAALTNIEHKQKTRNVLANLQEGENSVQLGKHEKHALPVEGIDVEGPSRNGRMFPATFIARHGVNSTEARKGTELQKLIRYSETAHTA